MATIENVEQLEAQLSHLLGNDLQYVALQGMDNALWPEGVPKAVTVDVNGFRAPISVRVTEENEGSLGVYFLHYDMDAPNGGFQLLTQEQYEYNSTQILGPALDNVSESFNYAASVERTFILRDAILKTAHEVRVGDPVALPLDVVKQSEMIAFSNIEVPPKPDPAPKTAPINEAPARYNVEPAALPPRNSKAFAIDDFISAFMQKVPPSDVPPTQYDLRNAKTIFREITLIARNEDDFKNRGGEILDRAKLLHPDHAAVVAGYLAHVVRPEEGVSNSDFAKALKDVPIGQQQARPAPVDPSSETDPDTLQKLKEQCFQQNSIGDVQAVPCRPPMGP